MTEAHANLCELNDKLVDSTIKSLSSDVSQTQQLETCIKLLDLMNSFYYKYNIGFYTILRIAMACAQGLKKFDIF